MKFFTLKTMLLASATAATLQVTAQDETESTTNTFTPVTEITTGWYQIKETTGVSSDATTAIAAGKSWVVTADAEYKKVAQYGSGCYFLSLSEEPTTKEAKSYFYITKNGSKYSLQSTNGHYLGSAVIANTTEWSNVEIVPQTSTYFQLKAGAQYADAMLQNSIYYLGGYSSNSGVRYQFSKVENAETVYKVYTVKVVGDPTSSTYPSDFAQVTCSNAAVQGLNTVYNNGRIFVTNGSTLTASDISATAPALGYKQDISVDETNKTITVTYTQVFSEGDVVTITNVQKNGNTYQLYMDDTNGLTCNLNNTECGNKAYFVVKKDGNKFVFVSATSGLYMAYRGNGDGNHNGKSETYDANYSGFTSTSAHSTLANSYYLYTDKRQGDANSKGGLVIVPTKDGGFDGFSNSVGYTDTYSNLFRIEKVNDYDYNKVTLQTKGDKNYASVYLPFSYTLPDNVTAYYGRALNDGNNEIALTSIEGNIVPKQTAVVLVSDNVSGAQTLLPALNTTAPTNITDNRLSGTINTESASGKNIYGFTGKFDKIGFYKWTGENLPRGKAYIDLTATSQNAIGYALNFGEITGIEGIAATPNSATKVYYDISGRRVLNPTKGLYIVNGQKVVLK